jgi:RNA polymerase sigma-70 factor, ECF subfamily
VSRDAFTDLLEPALPRAYAVALHLTRNPADAEDLVQEAALLAYRGFGTFEPGTNFRAWFVRIVTNTFLSNRRKKRPETTAVSLDEAPSVFVQRKAHEQVTTDSTDVAGLVGGDVARAVVGKLETEQVSRAIAELPEEFRTAAALYFLDDFSYQQIADALNVPVGTVRSRLHRGRALLQQKLWRLAEDHGIVKQATDGRTDGTGARAQLARGRPPVAQRPEPPADRDVP